MRLRSFGPASGVVCQLCVWCGLCCAQSPGDAKRPEPKPAAQEADDEIESKLQEKWLPNEDGNLRPVYNVPLPDLERALQMGEGPKPPSYTIEQMNVAGEVRINAANETGYAKLSIEFTIKAGDKQLVRVPLRLGNAVLAEPAKFHDDGEHRLSFDSTTREYVAWFRGESEKAHRLTLPTLVGTEIVAGRNRLRLSPPRANSGELLLKVPLARAAAEVTQGGQLTGIQPSGGVTEIKAILNLASDFELAWNDAAKPQVELRTLLEAKGEIVTKIEGSSIQSKALLAVGSFGGEFQSFRVRLPHGATLVPETHEGYSVALLNVSGDDDPRLVEVRLSKKTVSPFKVHLTTQQPHDVARSNELAELGGFEVLGAVRQWGYIALQVDDAWQVSYGKLQRVAQVEELPVEMRRGDLDAGFAYFGQPYSLPARILPRATVLFVEPSYVAQVHADRVELASTLKYQVGGAKAFALEIDFSGWEVELTNIDSLEPPGLVDGANVVSVEGLPLRIPFKQAIKGEVKISIRAHRPLAPGADAVEFTLPHPKADTVAPADLIVVPADNVEVIAREADLVGLVRRPLPAATVLPSRQHEPLGYRVEPGASRFAAAFHVDTRRVMSRVRSVVALARPGGGVSQTIAYQIAHEAADSFLLDVPQSLVGPGLIEASVDGHTLPVTEVGPPTEKGPAIEVRPADDARRDEAVPEGTERMRVTLLEKRIGTCDLVLKYKVPDWQPGRKGTVQANVPLVMPVDGQCLGNELTVLARGGIDVQLADAAWKEADDAAEAQADVALRLTSSAPRGNVRLGLRLDEPRVQEATLVERAWLQTRFGPGGRRDRAVFAFTSQHGRLSVRLPEGILSPQFRLDGVTVADTGPSLDQRVISLPKPGHHVLEVSYVHHATPAGARGGRAAIEVPQLDSGVEARETYWQLVLPRDEYLLTWPEDLVPESTWAFNGFCWARRPTLDQAALETWSGLAEHATPLSPVNNRYLFSTTAIRGPLVVQSARRSIVVLAASGLVLVFGLAWIYLPVLRHPAALLIASVGLLAAAALAPELAVIGAQAAALGLMLVLVAGLLKRGTTDHRSRLSLRGASSSIVGRGSTHSHPRLPVPAPGVSTSTAAVAVEVLEGEANR
ncbi:MAG TPA: hypothetical protein VGX78_06020 [Pirellulales bacterium]|nr:hypothetical protein [Pirellulales bacterium]